MKKISLIVIILIVVIILLIIFVLPPFSLHKRIVRIIINDECYKLSEYQCKDNINCQPAYENILTNNIAPTNSVDPAIFNTYYSKYSHCEKFSEEVLIKAKETELLCNNTGGSWQDRDKFNKLGKCQCPQMIEGAYDELEKYYFLDNHGCLDLKTFCDNVPESRCKVTNQAYIIKNSKNDCFTTPNSTWYNYRSECMSYFSPETEATTGVGQIKRILAEYYKKQIKDIKLEINRETDSFIFAIIDFKDSPIREQAVLAKVNDQWQLAFSSSGGIAEIPCQITKQYNIPSTFISKCKDSQ
ncbi:hypothetical protein ACFL2U_03110 [Patescibacteria group bacterium]